MAYATGSEAYRVTQVKTSTPADLLLMLYDGGIKWCRRALFHLERNENEAVHGALTKSQDIIGELMIGLDFSADEDIAKSLYNLYDYMYGRLVDSNIKKDGEGVTEVLGMLQELREVWGQAAQRTVHQAVGTTGGLNIVK